MLKELTKKESVKINGGVIYYTHDPVTLMPIITRKNIEKFTPSLIKLA